MIKFSRFILLLFIAAFAFKAQAQSTATTSSPYSSFGLGDYTPPLLPQTEAMGGIGTAINRINGYNNINPLNPASYGLINFTAIDAGIYSSIVTLNQTGQTGVVNANFRLSHVVFAIPVTKHSALSFGLLPYTQVGYNYKITNSNFGSGTAVDTNTVNYLYTGNGGLSKAYFGYGYHLGKHLLIGANVSYIFGNIQNFTSTEVQDLYGIINSRTEQSNSIRGINYDYGLQYSVDFGDTRHLTFGYSGSAASNLSSVSTYIVSQYTISSAGNENVATDSLVNDEAAKTKIKLPLMNHFGISFQSEQKFLVGADYTMAKWSALTIDGTNAGLQDSKTFNIGGQITPNANALRNVFARTDYRAGFKYEDTYLHPFGTDIKSYAVTFGFGLPLAPNNTSFYKINFAAEIGQRGTLAAGLVKENYINIRLGFTLNDRWFQRFRFE